METFPCLRYQNIDNHKGKENIMINWILLILIILLLLPAVGVYTIAGTLGILLKILLVVLVVVLIVSATRGGGWRL